tara:strand:- start:1621 stop:2025 length:405 start_codon:yes stop_codon:yes gene_type:complete
MKRKQNSNTPMGPSQRQLRAGELVRHALVDILAREEFRDPQLQGVSVTIGEVRTSPDLKHATVFCSPLVGSDDADAVAAALNRASAFIRGKLGRMIDMKYTPELRFLADTSYDEANAMERLLDEVAEREDFDQN